MFTGEKSHLTGLVITYILVGMSTRAPRKPKRHADRTRNTLIHAAFEEIWQLGFQAASLDAILERAGVTKGALYHHFQNKQALGYAVVDEYIRYLIHHDFLRPLDLEAEEAEAAGRAADPLGVFLEIVRVRKRAATRREALAPDQPSGPSPLGAHMLRLGCPLNNLAQEMSPIDEGFRQQLAELFRMWRDGLATALRRGQRAGTVRRDLDPDRVAAFLVAALEGIIGTAKAAQSGKLLAAGCDSLSGYVESLRARR